MIVFFAAFQVVFFYVSLLALCSFPFRLLAFDFNVLVFLIQFRYMVSSYPSEQFRYCIMIFTYCIMIFYVLYFPMLQFGVMRTECYESFKFVNIHRHKGGQLYLLRFVSWSRR